MGTGVYGLLGPNGAGKTTLIRTLADVLRPTKGRVLWDGKDIHAVGDEYRVKIGYQPQDISFYGNFTGRDYLEYSATLKGINGSVKATHRGTGPERGSVGRFETEMRRLHGCGRALSGRYVSNRVSSSRELPRLERRHPVHSHLCPMPALHTAYSIWLTTPKSGWISTTGFPFFSAYRTVIPVPLLTFLSLSYTATRQSAWSTR